ncbi:acetate CoA-transferase subunit alpha [Pelosinus propionicus]|uniref:Acetate CoA/acetoacetate CoA-transferase alpha subunit n=1 Tax=Pelosinus propionicus DSM 13327 TaxID=1123291 RepID=A0A1I4LZM3_9FIRM|nr:acetate CoA-transferase subunit alpha [Pelosinus propionicus]SFL96167.1 acetate CoA/acetoacetate CoA-transferase alpha subunit [Pelosinus propionicus DSM 13327]
MSKLICIEQVAEFLYDGMVAMFGGFLGVGTPEEIIQVMIDNSVSNITLIANDTSFVDKGVGKLIANRQVTKAIVSHIGTNPSTGKQMIANEIEVELVPQGTLIERIRCGGSGLGGFLTPTGIGTMVEKGKQKLVVDEKEYLLETPLRANIAFIKAKAADRAGNLIYDKTARNFNPLIAMAADMVIAEVDEIVEIGAIDPDQVITPGILVDKIICKRGC